MASGNKSAGRKSNKIKLSKVDGAKPKQQLTEEQKRRTELEAKIRKKVGFEEKAFRLVEKLLDNPITEEFFIEAGKYIDASHYSDVVEERAIIKQCGYPICSNTMHNVPSKKYHISTKTNEVYDITDRKNFCSNRCFNASQYYAKQLSTVPVWLREDEKIPAIRLFSLTTGSPGNAVIFDTRKTIANEVQLIESMQRLHMNTLATDNDHSTDSCTKGSHLSDDLSIINDAMSTQSLPPLSPTHYGSNRAECDLEIKARNGGGDEQLPVENVDANSTDFSSNDLTETGITSYADNSAEYSVGTEEMVRELLLTELLPAVMNKNQNAASAKHKRIVQLEQLLDRRDTLLQAMTAAKSPGVDRRRTASCDKLQKTPRAKPQRAVKMISALPLEQPSVEPSKLVQKKPAQDGTPAVHIVHKCLMEWKTTAMLDFLCAGSNSDPPVDKKTAEMDAYESKVEKFLRMSLKPEESLSKTDLTNVSIQSKTPDLEKGVVLPCVDSHAQMAIRRKIVCSKIIKVLPSLLGPLKVDLQVISGTIRRLVDTFRLTSENVTLRPTEWTLLTLILLQLLRRKLPQLETAFRMEYAVHVVKSLVLSTNTDVSQLDAVVEAMMAT